MMEKRHIRFQVILISIAAWLALTSAGQAAYNYHKTVTVDHTRVGLGGGAPPPSGFGYIKSIVVNNTQVSGTSDLADFPVLVRIQNDPTLKTTANGGRVTDPEGDDIVFYDSDAATRLDYEVEQYDGATGSLVAWVRLPVLRFNAGTVFYLAYGNSGISSSQANGPGVWDGNFKGVWHLKENTGVTAMDSTANSNNATPVSNPTASAGQIGGALTFFSTSELDIAANPSLDLKTYSDWTISAWVKPTSYTGLKWPVVYSYGIYSASLGLTVTEGTDGLIENWINDSQMRQSNTAVTLNGWNHIVISRTATTTTFYLNGNIDGSGTSTAISSSGQPSFIGNNGWAEDQYIGLIDEVRVSGTNRSADWIATEYNNQSNPDGFMAISEGGGTPLVDFPVLVSIQNDEQLKTTANGGQVTDAEGDDIIFSSDAVGAVQLDHEVESYDGATGSLIAWVRLPILSVAEDTVFYLHYGNSAVTSSQQNTPGVWDGNYKGVWHLNDATDATVMDSTQYSNDGSPMNSPAATTASKFAGALDFDGINQAVIVDPSGITDNFTLEGWVYPRTLKNNAIDTYFRLQNAGYLRHDGINSLGQAHFYITTDGTNRHLRVNSQLADNTWVHLVGTWDGTNQIIYINGQLAASQQPGGTIGTPTVGTIAVPTGSPPDAVMDEVRYSDTARSAAWIATEYNNQQWPNKAEFPALGFLTVQRAVCENALPVACGSMTAGSIEAPGAWDAFKVTVATDTWLDIYTTGTTDTFGHLYDGNCVEIAQNDTSNYNFNISQAVAAGTYYLQVRHASESGTGDYVLFVECTDDDHGDAIEDATALDCGQPAGGRIGSAGDEDYFKVVFWGTGILTAYSTGGTDTRGTLLDDAGNPIAADDNSGASSNFKIVKTVLPGVYFVAVGGSASGDYTVQVDCEYTPVITASAEYGGAISPSGAVGVSYDSNQSFTITPDAGSTIRDVWVDGVWVGALGTYEFQNVQTDHKIVAVFNADFENCIDIPDIPLDAWYRSAPANVMFVLDDSGSMDWEFMTTGGDGLFEDYYYYVFDNAGDNLYGRVLPDSGRMKWQSQWAGLNKLYYDPAVDYQPWPNYVANDPALTLAHADPDTPRSHPMHASPTFNLNATYYQYTDDTSAIIVNDQDSGFSKTPAAAAAQTRLSTGFEGADWDDGFENNGTTSWNRDNHQEHSGTYSAWATKGAGGNLTSDDMDAGDANSITVDFWFRKDDIENGEFTLWYYDGSSYDFIADLDLLGSDDRWLHYQHTTTDSQYFKSNFRIRFRSTIDDTRENVWVDDVVVTKTGGTAGWESATGDSEAYNGDYWWTAGDGDYTATWTPDIPADGDYDVYARWHAADNHSQTVPYTVNYATGSDTVPVNQRLNGGEWVKLGTYSFVAGTTGNVTITYTRSGDTDRVCADAVKFVPAGTVDVLDIKRAHYYVWSASEGKPYLVVLDGDIAYYAVNDANGNNTIDTGEITAVASPPADVQTGRSYAEERQNFADWYQFYRRRELSASAAVSKVIAGLKGVQVGLYSINGNVVQPVVPVKTSGLDKSKSLLLALYNLNLRAQGTPLRRGLREVGKYFADSSNMIGSSPYATTANGGACQQAFTIVMTDGFWNGDSPKVGNVDGDANTAFDGGGYADIYSDTLADVAMKYYENDLHTGLDNNVPANAVDSATHQHMVTYAVSFGRVGSLNPADYDIAHGNYPVWPDPRFVSEHKIDDLWHAAVNGRGEFLNASNPTELVDSLLAISRSIESRIASSSSVSVNGDPLYKELDGDTHMYQATYRSDGWIGDVNAYQIDYDTGELSDAPDWSAADRLEMLNWNTGRIIATYDGSQGIPFRYDRAVLSADQQRALGSDLVADSAAEQNAVKILNYLRGERTYEAQNSGAFRDRFQVLGDIVHSSPVYHNGMLYAGGNDGMLHAFDAATGDELFAYVPNLVFSNLSALVDPDYSHKYYVDLSPTIQDITLSGQPKTILVGGLGKGGKGYYALDVTNPENITSEGELAARVLWEFPAPQTEGYLAFDNKTAPIAVGNNIEKLDHTAIGKVAAIPLIDGGSGLLELINVGGTGSFKDGDALKIVPFGPVFAQAAGELYDPYMGYSYSRPVIVKSNDPSYEWLVIFGNGYDSAKSHAVLYILNPATGALIKKIDTGAGNCNGLSSPIAIDVDTNHTADYVYAGDLQGNLWKFDLHDANAANWAVAYADPGGNPAPVFQAKNFSGHPQPITSKPDVMYHCSQPGYVVTFGTGRYLEELDLDSSETYSIYGIWDYGDDADDSEYLGSFERADTPQLSNPHLSGVASYTRVKLLEQTVEPGTWITTDGQKLRIITDNPANWGTVADDDAGQNPNPGSNTAGDTVHAGWYFDLPNTGEMAVSDVTIRDGKVLVISFTPGKDPCGSGGTSIFHAMDACTGSRTNSSVFIGINSVLYNGTAIAKGSSNWKEITGVQLTGRLQPPVILRKGGLEFNYLSSSSGEVFKQETAATKLGIFYWMQVE